MEIALIVFGFFLSVHLLTQVSDDIKSYKQRQNDCTRYVTSPTEEQMQAEKYYDKICAKYKENETEK